MGAVTISSAALHSCHYSLSRVVANALTASVGVNFGQISMPHRVYSWHIRTLRDNAMKKFLVLYRMDMEAMKKMMETSTPEDRQKDMDGWKVWMQTNMAHFADMGGPTGKNMQVTAGGAAPKSNDLGGYSIVQAESLEAATAMLADNPHLKMPGATIDLAEITAMGA